MKIDKIKEIKITEIEGQKCLIIPLLDIKQNIEEYRRDNHTTFKILNDKNEYVLMSVYLSAQLI